MTAQTYVARLTKSFVEGKTLYRNSDGSVTLLLNLAAKSRRKLRNPKPNSTETYATDFFTAEAFLSKEYVAEHQLGIYAWLNEGDLIAVDVEFRASENESYVKNGETVYAQKFVVIGFPEPLETMDVRRARFESKRAGNGFAGASNQSQNQAQAPQQAPVQNQGTQMQQNGYQGGNGGYQNQGYQGQTQPQAQPQQAPAPTPAAGGFQSGASPFGNMPSN